MLNYLLSVFEDNKSDFNHITINYTEEKKVLKDLNT